MVLPAPTPEEICTLGSSDIDTHHHVTSAPRAGADAFATASPTSTFEVTFVEGGCGAWPQEAIDAVTFATEIWGHHLASDIPIRVEATWDASMPDGTLGSAGPRAIISDASLPAGVGRPNTWYPIAQASAMAETDFVAQFDLDMDIRMRLNCNRDNWYFGTDAAPPAGTIDFVTVVLHELGHGIGFLGTMSKEDDVAEAGWGRPTNAGDVLPLVYDVFAEDTAATRLIDEAVYPNPSEDLFDTLRSGAVFAGGLEATAANDNDRPPLYAPSTWQPGSSFSHLDTDTFTGTENALMRHQIDRASAVHSPGPVFCGMLADMAWPLGGGCTDELGAPPALTVTPDVLDFSLVTEGSAATETVSIENTTSGLSVTGEVQVNGTDFTGLDGTGAFTLEAGEVLVVTVEFAPSAPEQRSGEIRITHDAATPDSPFTATLTGEGKAAPVVADAISDEVLQLGGGTITINLVPVFENVGAGPTYTAVSDNPGVVSTGISETELRLTAEGPGSAGITVTVDDNSGGTATTTFGAEVNQAPVVSASVADQDVALEGDPLTVTLDTVFTDPDGDTVQYSATSDEELIATAAVDNGVLTVEPLLPGQAMISLEATDGRGGAVGDAFVVTVVERQPPVVVNPVDDRTLTLGGAAITVDLDAVFDSPEGDALNYAAAVDPSTRLTLGLTGSLLTVTAMQTGPATVTATATDEAGAAVTDTFAVSVDALTVTVQRSFDDATDAANYRLVALPGAVDLDIAETLPGTTPGTTWRAFRDTGGIDAEDYLEEYRTNSADFRFQPGRGFWLLSTVDWTFDAVLDAAQPDSDGDVHVPLHAGWNIISNPTSLDLAWTDVLAHNGIDERLWRWADGAWADLTADTLRSARVAGEAFYFFNAGGANALETLQLPTAPPEEAALRASVLTEVPTFTLTLTQAGQPVSRVRLGEAATAQTYAAPPAPFGATRLALQGERPLAGRLYEALDDRAVDLTVTAAPGTNLTLTAADLAAVLGSQEAVLLEPSTGRRHDLRRTAEVPLRITTEETPLRLLIGSPAFIDDAAAPPPDLRLTRLYPNPSASAVTIEFSLPEALPIQLEVFDVLGRQVARLHEGELGPGTHRITWDGHLTHGSPAASGVYLVRLHAGDETRTKRLTRVP
jgi:hypothetical protein